MSSRLSSTLGRLADVLGQASDGASIRRVEVSRAQELLITLESPSGARWFIEQEGELNEIHPSEDQKVPLAQRLQDGSLGGEVQILSWRSGRRLTLIAGDNGATSIHKGWRTKRGARAIERHELLARACTHEEDFVVPKVLASSPKEASLELSRLNGEALRVAVGSAALWRKAGLALKRMQRALPLDSLDVHDWRAECAVIDTTAERARYATELPQGWERERERLKDPRASEIAQAAHDPVAAHRDLHDEQFLDVQGRVGLLDFDLLCAAHPWLDAANLTAHLELRALQGREGASTTGASVCARAFLEGFDSSGENTERRDLELLRGATFLRLAALYALRPRWFHLLDELVLRSRRHLDAALR